jgi:uncharacterized protein
MQSLFDLASLQSLTAPLIVVALFIYFIAGVVKGTLGIGFPTTAVSLLAQLTDARTAISLVIIPMVVTNAWQASRSGKIPWVFKTYWRLLVFMLLFIAIFSQLSTAVPVAYLTALLGGVITLYAASSLYKPVVRIDDRYDNHAQIATGLVAGVMGGIAGVWAPPILIYLGARRIDKDYFVATTGVLLFLGSVVLFAGYQHAGLLGVPIILISCVLLIPTMLGVFSGERIRQRLSAQRFERVLLWFFLLMGLNLVRRAFT